MSWLFSQALVAEYSAATCWGGAQSAPLSVMPTPHKFWRNDRPMEHSRSSRFGLTSAVLTADRGEALLMWFREDFLARTSQPRATASVLRGPAPACGAKWHELSVKYDLSSSRWKTHRCLWEEDLHWYSVTLPKWGMTRAGVSWEQLISAPPINDIESGSSPSTPVQVTGRKWPTPVASMAKGSSINALTRKSGADRSNTRLDHAVMAQHGGQLNPMWVEWLMGWPIGWTDLKPLEMARFREWQQLHSVNFQGEVAA